MFEQNVDLVTVSRTLVGKEFHSSRYVGELRRRGN